MVAYFLIKLYVNFKGLGFMYLCVFFYILNNVTNLNFRIIEILY